MWRYNRRSTSWKCNSLFSLHRVLFWGPYNDTHTRYYKKLCFSWKKKTQKQNKHIHKTVYPYFVNTMSLLKQFYFCWWKDERQMCGPTPAIRQHSLCSLCGQQWRQHVFHWRVNTAIARGGGGENRALPWPYGAELFLLKHSLLCTPTPTKTT